MSTYLFVNYNNSMQYKLLFTLFLFVSSGFIFAAAPSTDNPTLDHQIFISELKHSQDHIYHAIVKQYDHYIAEHPDDLIKQIEKCKFVQLAQYNTEEEYNPNQDYFDSCTASLLEKYPTNQDVLIYHTTFLWGEKKKKILEQCQKLIENSENLWTSINKSVVYYELALQHYNDEEFQNAYSYMVQAGENNPIYNYSLEFARILIELHKDTEALAVLCDKSDTVQDVYHLSQKSGLFLRLKDFSHAFELYTLIHKIDTSFNNNKELARSMEGMGQYSLARQYLLADTSRTWNRKAAFLSLFLHDLKYQASDSCITTYNTYRALGYSSDPMAIYRIKLFISHPFLSWQFRDILGILTSLLLFAVLIILPSVWILPVYTIGHKWKIIEQTTTEQNTWGLKSFWWVSAGYFFASYISLFTYPEYFHSFFDDNTYAVGEMTQEELGLSMLIFVISWAFFGLTSLFKINYKVLVPKLTSFGKLFGITIGIFIAFKIVSGIYIVVGELVFKIDVSKITVMPHILLTSRKDIVALFANYGSVVGYLLVAVLVPIYEEIIFRGVVLQSCKRYVYFHWANILQASLFALVHEELFLFPIFFAFGLVTGYLNRKLGGLLPGLIFHIVNNFLAL